MAKKKILTDNGKEILPITHESCVLDNNGVSIGSKIGNINELATDSRTDLVSAINDILEFKDSIKQENEETRNKLVELMQEGGYNITGEEDIDSLLDLLSISGIKLNCIKEISCGGFFNGATLTGITFILMNDGSLWGCGGNGNGQLGLGDTNNRTSFTQVTTNINNDVARVFSGPFSTFIIKNDGSLWACGYNALGNLGMGNTTTTYNTFTQVTTNINNDVKYVDCRGQYATFILKNDGSLWSCGMNGSGNLGLGDTNNRNTFTKVTTNINNDVKQVACGLEHTFILKNDGSIWSCGGNAYGELGLGDTNNRNTFTKVTTNINNDVKYVDLGYKHTCIFKIDGTIWSCGLNEFGQLGLNNTTAYKTFTKVTTNVSDVKQVVCGAYQIFMLKNDGSLWACGHSVYGTLGIGLEGSGSYKATFTKVTTNINNDVEEIHAAGLHVIILKNDNTLWGCGYNAQGCLGLGNTTTSYKTFNFIPRGLSY